MKGQSHDIDSLNAKRDSSSVCYNVKDYGLELMKTPNSQKM